MHLLLEFWLEIISRWLVGAAPVTHRLPPGLPSIGNAIPVWLNGGFGKRLKARILERPVAGRRALHRLYSEKQQCTDYGPTDYR
jgi:hypothetical protein